MKMVLEFEDAEEAELYLNGPKYFRVLLEMQEYLRGQRKYLEPEQRADTLAIEQEFFGMLNAEGVELL